MTAQVMTDDLHGIMAGSGGENAGASRMRKLVDALTVRRHSPKATNGLGTASPQAVDAYYSEEVVEDADEAALLVEEEEASVGAAAPEWSDEVPAASDESVSDREYDDGLPPDGGDEGDSQEPASGAYQNGEDAKPVLWDEVTPLDLERARAALAARREEMLVRQAAELQELDQEKAQVAGLADAVAVFMRRYASVAGPSAEAVTEPAAQDRY